MYKFICFSLIFSAVSCQIYYMNNDIVFDYPEEPSVNNYFPVFDNYPEVVPEYRVFSYPTQSYSQQMWTGCGCANAKTYGDYMKIKPRSKSQQLYNFYQMM